MATVVCQPKSTIPVSLLERCLPMPIPRLPLSPAISNVISTLYIGMLVLCAMAFASWMMDWESCESTIDQKIKTAFPDPHRRRAYMLKKVAEIDAMEKRKQEIEANRDLTRTILHDAVQLESEFEALTFEDEA